MLVESTRTGLEKAMAHQVRIMWYSLGTPPWWILTNLVRLNQAVLLEESRKSFQREAVERKRLHNLVQELKGNIRVFCRVKPLTSDEAVAGHRSSVRVQENQRSLTCGQHTFEFDRSFGPDASQAEVFEDISGLVTSVLDGYNVCIFAYGQTGAGKTHTMEGPPSDPGINYRALQSLFRSIRGERAGDYTYDISAGIVEVYNEQVSARRTKRALITFRRPCISPVTYRQQPLKLRRHGQHAQPQNRNQLTRHTLVSANEQVFDLLAGGERDETGLDVVTRKEGFYCPGAQVRFCHYRFSLPVA